MQQSADIEWLLRWCFVDQLPKRKTSSAQGIWDGIAEYGQRGGVGSDHGAAQRYPHFGLPHPDAIKIEEAVSKLANAVTDWPAHFELFAGDLASLLTINDMVAARAQRSSPTGESGWGQDQIEKTKINDFTYLRPHHEGVPRQGVRTHPTDNPRDVLLVNSINVEQIVYTCAVNGTRPGGWKVGDMRPIPTPAERGAHVKIIGVCKGKNSYTSGSYCPLRWQPSPINIVLARANYFAWHQALTLLAETLTLDEHKALPPTANRTPWIDGEKPTRIFGQAVVRQSPLPLNPRREQMPAPPKKPRNSKVRWPLVDKG